MDTTEQNNIGHERIRAYLKECQKSTPKGVSIKAVTTGGRKYLQLRFFIEGTEKALSCGSAVTMQGITEALEKSHRVSHRLRASATYSEFLDWYDREIRPTNKVVNNLVTFGDAILNVETAFWAGTDKKRNKRDRTSVSQQATYQSVYGRFYALLPADKLFNAKDLIAALFQKMQGSKVFGDCLYAFKRLALTANHSAVTGELDKIIHVQTEFRNLQNAELNTFLLWMKNTRTQSGERYHHRRIQWLWVFSMQLLYGFRVHEVFAIANIDKPFRTKDGVAIPALRDIGNIKMIAVVGELTALGTTTKTGYRLVAPMLPPSHPNLISDLDIKGGSLPELKMISTSPTAIANKYNSSARAALARWKAPITQTHALRHLCNQNGKQAGISVEDRAANLGHSVVMNSSTYLKREATNTRLAAIDASQARTMPLEGAIAVLKRIGTTLEGIALISEIYGVSIEKVREHL